MGTVTGYTAEKIAELLGLDVIDGEVVGDDLILTLRNGSTFNAGHVRGPQGDPGVNAATGDINPTPGTTPIRDASGRVKGFTPSATNDLVTKGYADAADSALSAAIASGDTAAIASAAAAAAGLYQPLVAAMPAPTATATVGADTSSTTELRDSVLGNYTFTAIAGHSYVAVLENAGLVPDTLGDQFGVRIRDGGASTPTSASTLIAASRIINVGVGKAHPIALRGQFTPSAGVHTLSCFAVRLAGTGVGHFWSGDLARQLYVIDLGR